MAPPDDRRNIILAQDRFKFLTDGEVLARRLNSKRWETYGTPLTDNQRMLRVIGVILDVAWNTNYATTRTAIGSAVSAL